MIDAVGRTRQAIEVLAEDLARQENRADAEASALNLGRNEVLVSFVPLGMADVSDWRLIEKTIFPEEQFFVM
jgi:shikimate 5-dehydrogenase